MATGRIIRVFTEVNLANSHTGLTLLAKKSGVDVRTMEEGTFLVFINRAQTKVKVLSGQAHLAYYCSPHGRLTMQSIVNIPMAFTSDNEFHMTKAIEVALNKLLYRKKMDFGGTGRSVGGLLKNNSASGVR